MKKSFVFLLTVLCFLACENDDPGVSTETLAQEIERGAVLRTVSRFNTQFVLGEAESAFEIELEEQDIEEGGLLERVDVYIAFIDNDLINGDQSTSEILLKVLPTDVFSIGPDNLPRTILKFTQQEALEALNVSMESVYCKDQFRLRLDLVLNDGRSFTTGMADSNILAFNTFFSSPYEYVINVVEPVSETLFIGTYKMTFFENGASTFGEEPVFVLDDMVTLERGHSVNTRTFKAWHWLHHRGLERKRDWEFTIACDETIFENNQLSSPEGVCLFNSGSPILLGPANENGQVNPDDDSVFELIVKEGFLGFDGGCNFGEAVSRIRFTKQ